MTQPTFSITGFVNDPKQIATNLIRYYNSSDGDQSTLFFGNVRSVFEAVATYGNNPEELASKLKDDVTKLFEAYFENVQITAVVNAIGGGKFDVSLSGTYFFKGVQYNLNENFGV